MEPCKYDGYIPSRDGSIPKFQPIPIPIPILEFLCQPIPLLEFKKKKFIVGSVRTFTSNVHKLHKLSSELSAQKTPKQHFSLIFPFLKPVYLGLKYLKQYSSLYVNKLNI